MATNGHSPEAPIFILSHARTGSTLLRYVIDTHPDVCCPPELALGRLCHALAYTLELTLPDDAAEAATLHEAAPATDRRAHVHATVRSHVETIMRAYGGAKGKRRWCDKSTNNVGYLDLIAEIFPDAQYVCLHRQCMDVVRSLLELFRWGFPEGYHDAVVRARGNVVDGMIDTWTEATERVLDFETAHASRCFRVCYEDLVANPASIAGQMFTFLDLTFEPSMIDAVFKVPHDAGPGDIKVQFTSAILRGRIGKGLEVPRRKISEDRMTKINALHDLLGYAPVSREGGPAKDGVLSAATNVSRPLEIDRWG